MWLGSKLASASECLFRLFFRFVFRYDIFISYARRDGKEYTLKLRDQLRQLDFSCFVDVDELPAGQSLNRTLRRALRRSATLVVVGTERATESRYVQLEVEEFTKTGRAIIPIDIEGSLAAAAWQPVRERDLVWIDEARTALNKHVPSPHVADQIDKLFTYTRRNSRVRAQVLATIGIFIVVVAVSLFLIRQQVNAARLATAEAKKQETAALQNATRARQEQDRAEERTRYVQAQQLGVQASLTLDTGEDPERSVLLSVESLKRSLTPEGYEAWTRGVNLLPRPLAAPRPRQGAEVTALAYSPDGRWFAEGARDGTVTLFETSRGRAPAHRWRLVSRTPVTVLAFGTDGRWVAAASTLDSQMKGRAALGVWDLQTLAPIRAQDDLGATTVVFSPDGRYVIMNDGLRPQGRVVAVENWSVVSELCTQRVNDTMWSAAFTRDGRWLAVGCLYDVEIWSSDALGPGASARKPSLVVGAREIPGSLTFSPEGGALAAVDKYGAVRVWDVEVRDETIALTPRTDLALKMIGLPQGRSPLVISPKGFVAALSGPNVLRVWDVGTGREVSRINHEKPVTAIAFSPDGKSFATADGHVSFWDARFGNSGARNVPTGSPEHKLSAFAVSPAGEWLVALSDDGLLRFLRMTDWSPAAVFRDASPTSRLTFSPDGRWLIAGDSGKVTVFDARLPAPLKAITPLVRSLEGEPDGFQLGFSPDERSLVVATGPFIRFFEKDSWRETRTLELNHRLHVSGVSFSPDGRRFAASVAGENPAPKGNDWVRREGAYVWDLADGAVVACIEHAYFKSRRETTTLCPGAPERQQEALLAQIHSWKPPGGFGTAARTAANGRWLAEIGTWNEERGDWVKRRGIQLTWKQGNAVRRVAHLMDHEEIGAWIFTPNSRWLVVSAGNALNIWPLEPSDMIEAACTLLRRQNLTADERALYITEEKPQPTCGAR